LGADQHCQVWGEKVQFDSTDGNIFVNPMAETINQTLVMQSAQAGDAEMDAARSIAFYRQISRRVNAEHLWLRTLNMQGPLDTAGLVLNQEEFFRPMYHSPYHFAYTGRIQKRCPVLSLLPENYAHKFRFWFAYAEDDEDWLSFARLHGKTG
jgi:hypothetical protein